ncbi:uncharacterized protein LY89DRAFT_691943 [Mollisia scopiformis]|uniref:Uncharacterized protein n=1 Tax=Mollisia scopiformis TaxID=149040 RepID=A0A132B422_MOLSC|nr:uncharacterized protein LY89DRAFT_691943 [Mollisia scopiformis]KUJ07140.1 hypothetical protein LY89DRAFT_691943 [Mollisia scopiformis]
MRGSENICLFCRHALSLRSSARSAKRFASTRQREPYVLPRLVIDLDAADSKYVRKIEELDEWYPASSTKPHASASADKGERRKYQQIHFPLKTIQVTPPDLLTFALMGDPGPWNRKTQNLRNIFRYRKIQPTDGIRSKAIQLSSEFIYDPVERLDEAGYIKRRDDAYVWQLMSCSERGGFLELSRLISMLSTTQEGCAFLAARAETVRKAIRQCRKTQTQEFQHTLVSSNAIVILLNNLCISLAAKGVKVSSLLCEAGLHYAAKSWNLPSLRRYLELLSEAPQGARPTVKALSTLMLRLVFEPEMTAGPMGAAAVKLITGWDRDESPVANRRRDTSFMSIFYQVETLNFYASYLVGLAEMGLKDILVAEWEADEKYAIGQSYWAQNPRLKAQAYALAFQIAGDRDYALSILLPALEVPGEPIPVELGQLSEQQSDGNDETSEIENNLPPNIRKLLLMILRNHYRYHNVRPGESLSNALKDFQENIPEDPWQFLDTFEKFLVRGYKAPFGPPPLSAKEIHWLDEAGVQGLVVLPEVDGNTTAPLYWKAASQAVVV